MAKALRSIGLVTAMALVAACGGGGSGGSLTAAGAIASVCQKALSCGFLTPAELDECRVGLGEIEMLIANPQRTVACVQGLSCAELDDVDYVVDTCVAYDTSQFDCVSSTALNVCNVYDECRDVDCVDICDRYASGAGSCGYDSSAGYDKCLCMVGQP